MPISYREQAPLTCPHCGNDFSAEIWLIIDADEEPAAAAALRREEVNMVACPHCGARGPAGAPLLYHDAQARRVLFAPAPGAADHEIREQARELHALLVGSIDIEQRRPYLADVDIAQDMSGLAHLLRRL
ncbi:CpXC domain-containing protein, partial [Chloroflexus sp.]|uniref:CpXC domain-containing protein n=1 Tax=Chloroflexus sp. TaxID=1904827 RepID=UPI002ACE03D7